MAYIEREAVLKIISKYGCSSGSLIGHHSGTVDVIDSIIYNLPIADVAPVKHGKWLNFYGNYTTAECDVCGECFEVTFEGESNKMLFDAFRQSYRYCPNCGVKMNGGD